MTLTLVYSALNHCDSLQVYRLDMPEDIGQMRLDIIAALKAGFMVSVQSLA